MEALESVLPAELVGFRGAVVEHGPGDGVGGGEEGSLEGFFGFFAVFLCFVHFVDFGLAREGTDGVVGSSGSCSSGGSLRGGWSGG